jgi:MerR family transcriptional regulator, copper efflux regulator
MPVQRSLLRIGELAQIAGLSPDALRHYERMGLLTATRTPGRFREYDRDAVHRIRVIQAALAIGFTLAELSDILAERAAGRAPCQRVRKVAGAKLAALIEQIEELSRLRRQLERTLAVWDTQLSGTLSGAPARLLDSLASRDDVRTSAAHRNTGWQSPLRRGHR